MIFWKKMDLNGSWQIHYISHDAVGDKPFPKTQAQLEDYGEGTISADVPGEFALALEKNGILPQIYKDQNVLLLQKYESYHVFYSRKFRFESKEGYIPEFLFEGLDTICEIWVNGQLLGKTDNMFIAHRFQPTNLVEGENEIVIHFLPVTVEARKYEVKAGNTHMPYNFDSLHIRKAPHSFGWDIMPRALSCGIFRPVWLTYRPVESIKQAYLMTVSASPQKQEASLMFFYELDIQKADLTPYTIEIEGVCEDSRFTATRNLWSTAGEIFLEGLKNVKLWQPKGHGKPYLYDVRVTLKNNGEIVDAQAFRTGIRTVELDRTSLTDAQMSGKFQFKVNGEKVFILGTNFVPMDAFHSRDAERLPKACQLLEDIGCNAIRMWGGNIYEDDYLYDFCDVHGILIWQDFMMACGLYPQDVGMQEKIRKEATAVVRRLRRHPSIMLWAGDNEVDQFAYSVTFRRNPNFNVLTRQVIPDVLRDEDPTRPYLPSSPYIDGDCMGKDPGNFSEQHLWGPRDYFKSDYYSKNNAHYASEMRYHGCNSPESVCKFISKEKAWPWQDNKEWIIHASSPAQEGPWTYRIKLMVDQIQNLFGQIPDNLEDFSLASQISQAEAMKFFIELFRLDKQKRGGIIWWNQIDGWPQFSDAVVDYYYDKKLAYHYIKNCQQPFLLTFAEPENGKLALKAINDTKKVLHCKYKVEEFATGQVVLQGQADVGDEVLCLDSLPYACSEKRILVITWETDLGSGKNHYLSGQMPFTYKEYKSFCKTQGGNKT